MSYSSSSDNLKPKRQLKLLGSCSLSLEDMLASRSQLWINKWISLDLVAGLGNSEPVLLHVSMSFSPPMRAPQIFQLAKCQHFKHDLLETRVMDCNRKNVFSLQKRRIIQDATKDPSDLLTEVYYITNSGEKHTLVECHENDWSVKGTHGSFKLQKSSGNDDSLFAFASHNKIVKLFPGRRLQPGTQQSKNEKSEDFMTMVEFSTGYPYGKAVGLIDSKSQTVKVMDEPIVLPSIALAFILSDNLRVEEQSNCTNCAPVMYMVKAADCACGPCKDALTTEQGYGSSCAPVMDMVKAADCACGPCKDALTTEQGYGSSCAPVMDMVKAADCACGPCKDALTTEQGYGSSCAPVMDMVKAADCACGP
ncbi:hypothetical protein KSS87_019104, partial [Heliosperma pusillum]